MELIVQIPDEANCYECDFMVNIEDAEDSKKCGYFDEWLERDENNDELVHPCKPCLDYRKEAKSG